MKYKLNPNSNNNYKSDNIVYDILKSKGIENPKQYLNLTSKAEISYNKLNDMDKAVKCLLKHIENNDEIFIQVDSDCDGYMSSGALYNYLKKIFPQVKISWNIHNGKEHGLDISQVKKNVKLVIVPDALLDDKDDILLHNRGIDCINLDHHEIDKKNKWAITINNQSALDYSNKNLSGVGIVYKFLQALDNELWEDEADNYLDMVAIGNIADVMDIRNLETRYYINKGLKKINNNFLKALISRQDYSLGGKINPIGIAFYIAPLINGLIRFGNEEEKRIMFQAIIGSDEKFNYQPRKKKGEKETPEPIQENIYEHTARICANAKARQDKSKIKNSEELIKEIYKNNYDKNKLIIIDGTNKVQNTMTGLVAIQLVSYFKKPCILLREKKDDINTYGGSIRGLDNSELDDFKAFLNSLNICDWVQGHPNAAGIQIKKDKLNELIKKSNEALKNINFDKVYTVDYIIPFEELTDDIIESIDRMKDIWGQGIKESLIAITNIKVLTNEIHLIGDKKNTIGFTIEDIGFIKFKCTNEDYEYLLGEDDGWGENNITEIELNVIGKCNVNDFGGKRKLQIIVEDWELINN